MCQMSVFLRREGPAGGTEDELMAENAALLEAERDGIRLTTLFEAPRKIAGVKVSRIDFLSGQVFLTTIN